MTLPSSSTSIPSTGPSSMVSVSHHQFTRNASCPTQRTLSSTVKPSLERKYSSSSSTLNTYLNPSQRSNTIPSHHATMSENASILQNNSNNILQRLKSRVVNLFKHLSNGTSTHDRDSKLDVQQPQPSTFIYDPELDLREEHLSLVAKRLLSTLRESKIKHLSCDNLFLPCNHLRNIARQCLIMAAEEPFGIMGAQIKIKLTLLSAATGGGRRWRRRRDGEQVSARDPDQSEAEDDLRDRDRPARGQQSIHAATFSAVDEDVQANQGAQSLVCESPVCTCENCLLQNGRSQTRLRQFFLINSTTPDKLEQIVQVFDVKPHKPISRSITTHFTFVFFFFFLFFLFYVGNIYSRSSLLSCRSYSR